MDICSRCTVRALPELGVWAQCTGHTYDLLLEGGTELTAVLCAWRAETQVWQAADLAVLSELTALEELDLSRVVLEDKPGTCEALSNLPLLKRLDLAGTNLTDECLPVLQRMRGPLTHLQLASNFRLTGEPASAQHWGVVTCPLLYLL